MYAYLSQHCGFKEAYVTNAIIITKIGLSMITTDITSI